MRRIGGGAAGPLRWALAAAMLMTLLLYVPTPYLVFQPGLAEPAAPLVRTASPDEGGSGEFLFTTVYLSGRSNYLEVLGAQLRSDRELLRKKDVLKGGTVEEYGYRSVVLMEHSQSDAIEAAYRLAGVPYSVRPIAVTVSDAGGRSGPDGLQTGDRIVSVNGVSVTSLARLQRLVSELDDGEARFAVKRNGADAAVNLRPDAHGDGLVDGDELPLAIGVRELAEIRTVAPDDPSRAVSIEARGVGGPSAGLIFALQAYDRLTAGDLTRGLRIAGTGTIEPAGTVGAVGGTGLKTTTAYRAGADLFLVPPANYREAVRKAEALGGRMRVLEAASLKDAVEAIAAFTPAA